MSRHNNPPDPAEVSAAPAPRRDPVTAMLLRKDFLLRLEQEMARALTRHRPLALALFEISPVSGMGNAETQVLLRTLASRLWDSAQTEDTLGRLEDHLLAFILPGSGPFHALALAESVVSDVWAMCDDLENFPLKAAVGASGKKEQGFPVDKAVDGLWEKAKSALKQASFAAHAPLRERVRLHRRETPEERETLVMAKEKQFLFFGGV